MAFIYDHDLQTWPFKLGNLVRLPPFLVNNLDLWIDFWNWSLTLSLVTFFSGFIFDSSLELSDLELLLPNMTFDLDLGEFDCSPLFIIVGWKLSFMLDLDIWPMIMTCNLAIHPSQSQGQPSCQILGSQTSPEISFSGSPKDSIFYSIARYFY